MFFLKYLQDPKVCHPGTQNASNYGYNINIKKRNIVPEHQVGDYHKICRSKPFGPSNLLINIVLTAPYIYYLSHLLLQEKIGPAYTWN